MADVIRNFRDLEVWQLSRKLVKEIYLFTARFPKGELYGLVQQIRRSAISIPSNIAEGHSRSGLKDYTNFISISIGSLAELETQLVISNDIGLLAKEELEKILPDILRLQKMLHSLRKSLRLKLKENSPNA